MIILCLLASNFLGPLSTQLKVIPTGCFRVRGIFDPPPISALDGPILKPFGVVIAISLRFCLVYLDGLHVGNYPSKICHHYWTDFGTLEISQSDTEALYARLLSTGPIS